tara:strand:+ start:143 stop:547 length:405 start_codon:yes stop_codon:yes gene_type:complete
MGIVISTSRELESGAGFYGYSTTVDCSTNTKSVILIKDSGYRDTVVEVFVAGSADIADPASGSITTWQVKLNQQVIWQTRINSIIETQPKQYAFQFFIPRNSELEITQTDADTTGSCTTMLRGYYLEPPVAQQD